MSKWYAIYTRPRWEKKVNSVLHDMGIESYCPLNKVRRRWSDRIKTIEEPLFKSYIFIKIPEKQRTEVRMVTGVINFVYWNGKPATIKEREIDTIKRFLDEHENVQLQPMELKPNQQVHIISGIFMDRGAKVLEVGKKMAKVAIESLGCELVAYIEISKLSSGRPI